MTLSLVLTLFGFTALGFILGILYSKTELQEALDCMDHANNTLETAIKLLDDNP